MDYHKSLKSFLAAIEKDMQEVMLTDVKSVVVDELKDNIQTEVYDKYTPSGYERRYENGGLLDNNNILAEIRGRNTLFVRSIRKDGDRDVAKVVEYGTDYQWTKSDIYGMQPFPRPFHYQTFLDLQSSLKHIEGMRQGLMRKGYKFYK